ncbi:MAG TPA: hypothetical protein PKD53_23780, partial [Chloroflexaceae bacterium]|nr:hypothetical protein [Chloroflexaceae bacterium]
AGARGTWCRTSFLRGAGARGTWCRTSFLRGAGARGGQVPHQLPARRGGGSGGAGEPGSPA